MNIIIGIGIFITGLIMVTLIDLFFEYMNGKTKYIPGKKFNKRRAK